MRALSAVPNAIGCLRNGTASRGATEADRRNPPEWLICRPAFRAGAQSISASCEDYTALALIRIDSHSVTLNSIARVLTHAVSVRTALLNRA